MMTPSCAKKTLRKFVVAALALAAGLMSGTVRAYDIRIERPNVWYSFDSEAANAAYRSLGATNLTFSACPKAYEASPNGQALSGTSIAYGFKFPYGSGDWTVVVRLKAKAVSGTAQTYPILLSFGSPVDAKGSLGLYMDGKTSDKMRWAMASDSKFSDGEIIDFDVPTANTAYHTYAAIYRSASKTVDVYCDGVKQGTLNWATCNADNANWCWYTGSGGWPEGSCQGTGSPMDDFRHYQRALSDAELLVLHNLLDSGSVYGGPLGNTSRVVWKNVKLSDIKKFHALTFSKAFNDYLFGMPWTASVASRTETEVEVQFQMVATQLRWVCVTFTQSGDDVTANIPIGSGFIGYKTGVTPGTDVRTVTSERTWAGPFANEYVYNVTGLTYDKVSRADEASRYTWCAAEGEVVSNVSNWRRYWVTPTAATLATGKLYLPYADGLRHTITVGATGALGDLAVDGHYALTGTGALTCQSLDMGATGRLEFDPESVTLGLGTAPILAEGAKFALPAAYANATEGNFRVMRWEEGTFPAERLADFFDASSCAATSPVLTVDGNSLWLILDTTVPATATWTGAVGDGNPATAGNWDCWNALNEPLEETVPTGDTVVTIPDGCTNSFPAGGAFLAREVVLPATLGADNLDWRGITAPFSGTLDLQGKTLILSQLAGTATITDTTPNLEYDLLDSITSDKAKKQYIKTGMIVESNVMYALDFGKYGYKKGESNCSLCALDHSAGSYGFNFCHQNKNHQASNEEPWFLFYGEAWPATDRYLMALNPNHDYRLVVDAQDVSTGNGSVKLTDTTQNITETRSEIPGMTKLDTSVVKNCALALFGKNNGASDTFSSYTLYRFWFREASGTEHTFVPVRQCSTGKYGLLDLEAYRANPATGFHGNAGTGDDFTAGTVTNRLRTVGATGMPGTLRVEVAAGTAVNTAVTLTGNLKLVKAGAGTFSAQKPGQTYAGGTVVEGGTFQVAAGDEKANRFAGTAGSTITVDATVDAKATLDVNGNPGFDAHPLVLAGGTVTSPDSAATAVLGPVTLTANSTVNPGGGLTHAADIVLGGNTLTVPLPVSKNYDLAEGVRFTGPGTVNVTSGGYIRFLGSAVRDMSQVNLILSCAICVDADITVNDLDIPYRWGNAYAAGDGHICIKGTFTPSSPTGYHRNCVMQDGSTLNLAGKTGVWSIKPDPPASGKQACTPVAFAPNATVTVSLGDRKVKNEQLVTWADATVKPDDSVTFVLDPALNARLVRKPDGLWLQTGFAIRIR